MTNPDNTSGSGLPSVTRTEAEARCEQALKVAKECIATTGRVSIDAMLNDKSIPAEIREALYARGGAIRNIIRILDDGKTKETPK